jgi:hypothetical protein
LPIRVSLHRAPNLFLSGKAGLRILSHGLNVLCIGVNSRNLLLIHAKGTPDWTDVAAKGELSEHVKFIRSVDWASTPLGDMSVCTFSTSSS